MKKKNWRETEDFNHYFEFDNKAGCAYAYIPNKNRKIISSQEFGGKIVVDKNKKGDIVGVEILNVRVKNLN